MTLNTAESRTRKYVEGYGFLLFARSLSNTYKNQLLDTGIDSLKAASEKVVHKTGEFLGNKITDAVAKPHDNKIVETKTVINENLKNFEQIIIPLEKREQILNEVRPVLQKWNIVKHPNY